MVWERDAPEATQASSGLIQEATNGAATSPPEAAFESTVTQPDAPVKTDRGPHPDYAPADEIDDGAADYMRFAAPSDDDFVSPFGETGILLKFGVVAHGSAHVLEEDGYFKAATML